MTAENEMSVELLDLTKVEVEEALDADLPLIVPTGSTEQHGPHLPLGTDGMIARRLAIDVAEQVGGLVAPVVYHGSFSRPKSGGGRSFRASIGVPPATVESIVYGFLAEALRQGFRRVVVLNAHFENADPAFNALESLLGPAGSARLDDAGQIDEGRAALLINWWELLTDDEVYGIFGDSFPGWPAEHAGVLETSVMEHYEPALVKTERKVVGGAERTIDYERFPTPPETIWPSGIGSTSLPASPDLGRQTAELVVRKAVAAIERDLAPATGAQAR
jgi:creatinine amidohydrolase